MAKTVTTDTGRVLPYDMLVLATGLTLDDGAIRGKEVERIGRDGLGSVYAGPVAAEATWRAMSAFADIGGPADWALVALIFLVGAAGATLLAYAVLGLTRRLA